MTGNDKAKTSILDLKLSEKCFFYVISKEHSQKLKTKFRKKKKLKKKSKKRKLKKNVGPRRTEGLKEGRNHK